MKAAWIVFPLLAVLSIASTAHDPASDATGTRRRAVGQPTPLSIAPVTVPDQYSVTQGSSLTILGPGVLANDSLHSAVLLSYGAVTGGEQATVGTATVTAHAGAVTIGADGGFTYTPAPSFLGADTFLYIVRNTAGTSTATVTVSVVGVPVAADDTFTTQQGAPLSQSAPGVLANDTQLGASIVSYGAVTGAEMSETSPAATPTSHNGSVILSADGGFVYTPAAGFTGADTFLYILSNGVAQDSGLVTINVQAHSAPDFSVAAPGFFYTFTGVSGQNPPLTLVRGRTYTFLVDVPSFHPFEILGAPAGSVSNNNISSGTVTFRVPSTAANYRYHCSVHDFGNAINTTP